MRLRQTDRLRRARVSRPVLLLLQGALVLAAAFAPYAAGILLDTEPAVYFGSVVVASVIVWDFLSWRLAGRSVFEPYGFFLLAAAVFNGGHSILEIAGVDSGGVIGGRIAPDTARLALHLVAIGLASLHFGALAATGPRKAFNLSLRRHYNDVSRQQAIRTVGWWCLGVAAIPMMLVLRDVIVTVGSQGYGGLYNRSRDAQLPGFTLALASFLIPAAMFLTGGSAGKKTPIRVASLLILLYACVMLMVGCRAPATMVLTAFVWLWHRTVRPISRVTLLAAAIALLVTFPLLAAVRNTAGIWRDPAQIMVAAANQTNPIVAALSEMGNSLLTVADTLTLVPSVRPYDFGVSYAYAASALVPNIGWDVHPVVAHGLWGDWLIRSVDPTRASVGGGLGFSFIAEAYANFGWYGMAASLAVLGWLLNRLFDWGIGTGDRARYAMIATFLAFFLIFARGESAAVTRSLGWYAALPYGCVCLLTRRRARRSRQAARRVIPADMMSRPSRVSSCNCA